MMQLKKNSNMKSAALSVRKSKRRKSERGQSEPTKSRERRRKPKTKDPTEGLSLVHPNAAAIDLSSREHWAAIPPNREGEIVRKFGCFTGELEAMADWLAKNGVDTVVMEATGNYWVVVYDLLEQRGLKPYVINARYAKNMQGRKTDVLDCQWMQKLHSYGLFNNSFRPPEAMRVLRTYLRQRENLVAAASQAIQHMQKALVEMNVQLATVISDISGETGLGIIDAILGGERNPAKLVSLKNRRIRASDEVIMESLRGHWKEEMLFVLKQSRQTYAHFVEQIQQCDDRIRTHTRQMESRPGKQKVQEDSGSNSKSRRKKKPEFDLEGELERVAGVNLAKIDGIGTLTAQTLISEVGVDMSPWPTEKHFASWLALCPDHRVSGGKILGRSTRPVVSRARNALRMAAYTLENSRSALGAKYRRLKRRLGAPKAIVAMANHLAKLVYRMLKHGTEYVDKGMEHYEARFREQQLRWLHRKAAAMNMKIIPAEGITN